MSTGFALFQRAEHAYHRGNINAAFELYQKSIKKIIKDEDVTALFPPHMLRMLPDNMLREVLAQVWCNFCGFLRDPQMSFPRESHPDAFKLLDSFRPSSAAAAAAASHPQFVHTAHARVLLKGIQIVVGMTLGVLAWDARDRATAAKRYKETLDLAATPHAPFYGSSSSPPPPGASALERWFGAEAAQARDNLDMLLAQDRLRDVMLPGGGAAAAKPQRKEVVALPLSVPRQDKTGAVTMESSVVFASDACGHCGKRDVKLMRCSRCKKMPYCNAECQRAHWKAHKASSCVAKQLIN